ncbi:ABC transporter permease [Paenibacillus sp. MMS20-IR301]|uniref:ABC transporter permease n=1 Tax=Paenibacillus sp. MMS20-IR301 TaxID=2895946 RepID=UPI0028E71D1B|nr:ABC transporter permease [Paenibacillus sp. MMS20-IR301]WNS45984.1 ABC transporter permease [Paenibacillus sp. MMS20-IR301]
MNISYKRSLAIFVKDYKEFSRNYALSIMLVFPVILAVLFRGAGASLPGASGFLFNTSFVLLTCFAQACLIAEEKERNTLRSLMMTPATTMDVLAGKSALVFAMSVVILGISTLIFGYKPVNIWVFAAVILLSIILYTAAGTICGLYSKTVLESSLSILPVATIFMGAPWGAVFVKDYPVLKVLDYVPSSQLVHFLGISNTGYTAWDIVKPLLITLIWTILLTLLSVVLYVRRLKDE